MGGEVASLRLSNAGSAIPPPLIPVRMLNEYVYFPRLAYMMWVQGEFAASADRAEGSIRHRRVDRPAGRMPPAKPKPKAAKAPEEAPPRIHVRSVALGSETLGITAKIDLLEGRDGFVVSVDYKKASIPTCLPGPTRRSGCRCGWTTN